MVANEGYKEFLLWRMLQAITSSIFVQFFLISGVIFFSNVSLIHPFSWIQATFSVVISFRTLSYFILLAVIIFIQGFICSKNYLNPPQYAKSRFTKFCNMFSLRNILMSSLYITIGGVLAWLHLSLSGGQYSSLIKQCTTSMNRSYCFVEGYYYLILSGFWTGFYFVLKTNILEMQHLRFSIIAQTKFSQLHRGIYVILPNAMFSAIWPSLYFLAIYYLLGDTFRDFIMSMLSLSMENEPLNHLSNLFQPILICHAWLHAVLFILSMNSMHLLFQAYLTEWVPFSIDQNSSVNKSCMSLMEALARHDIPIIQHLAFLDLLTIAQKDKLRRNILFSLSQPGGHPYNWNSVVQKYLVQLKEFASNINSTTTSSKKDQIQVNGPTLAKSVIKGDSEKPVYVYHMRNLVSPSVPSPIKAINCEIPKQSVPGEQLISHYFKMLKQNVITYLLSKPLINYIFAEQMDTKVKHILLNGQPVIWAADAVSSLVAISIKEDPYGIVQKDIPTIIETLLNAKESLDKLQKTNVLNRKPVSDEKDVRQMLTAIRSSIRRSIYRIVHTFKDYINDIGLEPYILTQLQAYLNCKE